MDKPWLRFYEDIAHIAENVEIPDKTLYEMLALGAEKWPDQLVIAYMGRHFTYSWLLAAVDECADGLAAAGVTSQDSVVVSLPNIPNVVIAFYAVNKLGARAVLTHPLSSTPELEHYITQTGARFAITVDMFYSSLAKLVGTTPLETLVIAHIWDYLKPVLKVGFKLTKGRKIAPVPKDAPGTQTWADMMAGGRRGKGGEPSSSGQGRASVTGGTVVLFSGGTTSLPKGIELTAANFNALAISMGEITGISLGHSVLAILPAFHGFGLGLCIHTPVCVGANFILVPEFSPKIYIDNLIKYKPSFIAGVPTLFQALLRDPRFAKVDFSAMKGAYSGGDLLTPDLKRRFDEVLTRQGGTIELVEGYGMTECVTACVVSPRHFYRDGSMGIPIPGATVGVFDPDTGVELPYDTAGEICMYGPTMMNGYVNDEEATAHALRLHDDGLLWLHTGDIGTMDSDGFLYFKGRIKRLLKISGVSVYPMQVEQVLEAHPAVSRACVVGVPDDYQMTRLKAFVILETGYEPTDTLSSEMREYCKQELIKWAVPRDIEFRDSFPMTRVGKIAYTELEKEAHS
ncbi:MAG: acyl--CoA ligase [Propionibacteriaceae bacterium]|jgi:long-chain acyl-CoA synthetase|nr:acyl--CoA ligase [Propionibacteriaceae bacterium]